MQENLTTLVCLFHHDDQAAAAVRDLREAGLPESSISIVGGNNAAADALDKSELASLGMPITSTRSSGSLASTELKRLMMWKRRTVSRCSLPRRWPWRSP